MMNPTTLQNKELVTISTASAAQLEKWRAYCGLKVSGKKSIWGIRKSATSPITGKESFLKLSTKTSDLRTAIARALPQVENFLARVADPAGAVVVKTTGPSTLGELFEAYRVGPTIKANPTTRERNIKQLSRIVRLVHGKDFEIEKASSAIISKQLALAYQTKRLAAANELFKKTKNLAAIEAVKRGTNSALTHAQSLFSKGARNCYDSLTLGPGTFEFNAAMEIPARKAERPERLKADVVQNLRDNAARLYDKDLTTWAGYQLMVWGGLRNVECLNVKKHWMEKTDFGYKITMRAADDSLPKGNSRSVIIPEWLGLALLAITELRVELKDGTVRLHPTAEEKHLVPALNPTDRNDALYRRLNEWLTKQGVTAEANKIAYRLRKEFLATVNEQQGPLFAQSAAGHSQMRTLQDNYIGLPQMVKPIELKALPGGAS